MPICLIRESRLSQSPPYLPLQRLIQSPQEHVRSCGRISVHGNDGVAVADEVERARFVEITAGKVEAIEIIARRPQPLKKVESVLIAGDQTRDLRSPPFDPAAVRRKHCHLGSVARYYVHRVIDVLQVVLCQIVVAPKLVGRNPLCHACSLSLRAIAAEFSGYVVQPARTPSGTRDSGIARTGVMPSAYPISKSIPSETMPRILRGGRLTTKSACLP